MKKQYKLLLAFVLVCLMLGAFSACDKAQPRQEQVKLYWNVEKFLYAPAETIRIPRDDGNYYMRMACEGAQIDIPVADLLTSDYVDTLEVMGLQMDENGVVSYPVSIENLGTLTVNGTVAPAPANSTIGS